MGYCETRCGVAYASFSKVTLADLRELASDETGVMDRVTILPLIGGEV
jgi:hypothetical protein